MRVSVESVGFMVYQPLRAYVVAIYLNSKRETVARRLSMVLRISRWTDSYEDLVALLDHSLGDRPPTF